MQYIYHRVPKGMTGNTLYPLNQLKDRQPDLYEDHVKKYIEAGKEKLLTAEIPPLKCLWNEVIHFTVLNPQIFKEAIDKEHIPLKSIDQKWFEIEAFNVTEKNSLIFTYRRDLGLMPIFDKYEFFNSSNTPEYIKILPETLEFYKTPEKLAKPPFSYHMVPQILFKGTLDVSKSKIIEI